MKGRQKYRLCKFFIKVDEQERSRFIKHVILKTEVLKHFNFIITFNETNLQFKIHWYIKQIIFNSKPSLKAMYEFTVQYILIIYLNIF